MPNLQQELDQLLVADEHIEQGERRVADLRASLERSREQGFASPDGEETLHMAIKSLSALREHRRVIQAGIDEMRAGRLPGAE